MPRRIGKFRGSEPGHRTSIPPTRRAAGGHGRSGVRDIGIQDHGSGGFPHDRNTLRNEVVDAILVGGVAEPKPRTKFRSRTECGRRVDASDPDAL